MAVPVELASPACNHTLQFFHLDALSSMVGLKVDFDLQITLIASSLYRLLAPRSARI